MKPKEEETSLDAKERGQGGDSDQEMMNLENELYSLTHYADDEEELVAQMFATIKGSKLEAMMPPILKEIPLIDVQQLCLHELRGMSQRRILSIINGQEMSGSSSEDSDSEKKPNEPSENVGNENDDSKVPTVTVKIEPGTEDLLTGKDLTEFESINESSLTTLDILELEMRAKLIKTMLEKQDGDGDEEKDEEETNGLVPNIKIKEEPLTPESTHNENNVSPYGSPKSPRRSRHSRRKRKHRHRSDSQSYSSSRSGSRSSYSSSSRSRSKSRTRSRSRSHSHSMSYTPELKKDGSESPKSKKTKKKISKKEFEARMQKAKMNRRYRKRKESEEDSGETAKVKQISNETEEPSEKTADQTEENNEVFSEEKNTEPNEAENEEPAEEGEVEEKEEGEIDSNEEDALSKSSRSYSRSYSSDSYSSYSSSSSRSYSRSPKRRRSRKSKKKRRHRRHRSRSRSLSDVPKIPNWKPKDSAIINNLDSNSTEAKINTEPEPKKTVLNMEDRQSISFSINKKGNTAIKKSSELGDPTVISTTTAITTTDITEQDTNTEEGNCNNINDAKVASEKSLQTENEETKPQEEDVKSQAVAVIAEDFYKEAAHLSLSDEGECIDVLDDNDNNTLTENNSNGSSIAKVSRKSKKTRSERRKRKKEVISVYEDETVLSEDIVNVDSPFNAHDIPKDEEEAVEEISQISSLPDVGEDSTQDVLEPLTELEQEDSRESHSLDIIGVIDPAEKQNDGLDEEIAAGGSSWSMRWLQSEKVQKVVSNSKMLSKVRKKIQARGKGMVKEAQAKGKGIVKEAPKAALPKPTIVETKPESPKIEVKLQSKTTSNVIGSIEEYEKLVGIKVKAPTSLPQPKPQAKSAPTQVISSILDSDDDEDSEEEAIWSKIMKK